MQDHLSTTFAALADPTRRAILSRLIIGEASVTELAEPFEMSMPAVSKHLKVLERAGLIARSREAQWRPCKLEAGPLKEVSDWVEHYKRFWTESFDRLDDYLRRVQRTQGQQADQQQAQQPQSSQVDEQEPVEETKKEKPHGRKQSAKQRRRKIR